MKKSRQLFFLFLLSLFCADFFSQDNAKLPALIPYRKVDKWGYADSNRKIIIEPVYLGAGLFENGIAVVNLNGKYACIKENGELITKPEFDTVFAFQENKAVVRRDKKFSFITNRGEPFTKMEFDTAFSFNDGFAFVGKRFRKHKMKYAYINTAGKLISDFIYTQYYSSKKEACWRCDHFVDNGLIIVHKGLAEGVMDTLGKIIFPLSEKYDYSINEHTITVDDEDDNEGLADFTGKMLIPCKYFSLDEQDDSEIYFTATLSVPIPGAKKSFGKYNEDDLIDREGIVSRTGKEIIPCIYDRIYFDEDDTLINVELDGKEGFVNLKNEVVIPLDYDSAFNFLDGFARVAIKKKWGLINTHGKIIIPLEYDWIGESRWDMLLAIKDSKYGMLNTTGKIILPFDFDKDPKIWQHAYSFYTYWTVPITKIYKKNKYGFVNKRGEIIAEPIYDDANDCHGITAWVKQKDKYALMDTAGTLITEFVYDDVYDFQNGYARVIKKTEDPKFRNLKIDYYGFLDEKGREITPAKYPTPHYDKYHRSKKFLTLGSKGIELLDIEGKFGYIDKYGNEYWE